MCRLTSVVLILDSGMDVSDLEIEWAYLGAEFGTKNGHYLTDCP